MIFRKTKQFIFALLIFSGPSSYGADWSSLQAFALSFLDIENLAKGTMSTCEKSGLSPENLKELQDAYAKWNTEQLPYQTEVREAVITHFSKMEGGNDMLQAFQSQEGQKELKENFPTDPKIATRGYCTPFFLDILKGKRMATNFQKYSAELKEYGNFKIFIPRK